MPSAARMMAARRIAAGALVAQQLRRWECAREDEAAAIVDEQLAYWRAQHYTPGFVMLLLTGQPRLPGAKHLANWVDVFDAALEAYRNVAHGRVVSFWSGES